MAGRRAGEVRHDRNGERCQHRHLTRCAMTHGVVRLHFANGQWPAKDRANASDGETSRWAAHGDELQRHGIVTTQNRQTIMLASSEAQALAMLAETRKEREAMTVINAACSVTRYDSQGGNRPRRNRCRNSQAR